MRYEFATPEPPRVRLGIAAGRVRIDTAETAETVVEVDALRGDLEALRVEQHGREIVIEHRKRFGLSRSDEYEVRIAAPHGTDADLNVASANLEAQGRLGTVEVNSASGAVEIEHAGGNARVRTASGDVRLASVEGRIEVTTASGDVQLGRAGGDVVARSASGDVHVTEGAAGIRITTASGDQLVESVAAGKVELKSASGDCRIGIKRGSRVFVDARSMSGETASELELSSEEAVTDGPLVELKAATMSGDIQVVRA